MVISQWPRARPGKISIRSISERMGLPEAEMKLVLAGNAVSLLKLSIAK
jgi:hypothetical protein